MSIDRVGAGSVPDMYERAAAEFGGDPQTRAALMLLGHAQQSRETSRAARAAAEERLRSLEATEVAELREQAQEIRKAALWRGIGKVGEGLSTAVASGLSAYSAVSSSPTPGARPDVPGALLTQSPGFATAGGKMIGAATELGAAAIDERAHLAKADAEAAEHREQAVKRRIGTLEENAAGARDLARAALDFLRSAEEADADAQRAALFARV